MELSNFLAEIWGISIAIVSLALLVKEKHLKRLFASMETEEGFFMFGVVSLVVGIATILSHNIWVKNWQVVITIFGYISLIKGLSLLFVPEFAKSQMKKMENSQALPFALLVSVFIGLALTYFGFTA